MICLYYLLMILLHQYYKNHSLQINKMISKFFIALITIYQKFFSPMLGSNCRFQPTCSEYTVEAIHKFGAFSGIILGLKRIIKCRPGGGCGFDPVPEELE